MWAYASMGFLIVMAAMVVVPFRFRCGVRMEQETEWTVMIGWPYGLVYLVLHIAAPDVRIGVGGRKRHLMARVRGIRWIWTRKRKGKTVAPRPSRRPEETPKRPENGKKRVSWRTIRVLIKSAHAFVTETLKAVRRSVRLQRVVLDGEYGGENPAVTGTIYGWSQALSHNTGKRLVLRLAPNFERQTLRGAIEAAGAFVMYPFLWFPCGLAIALISRLTLREMVGAVRELYHR